MVDINNLFKLLKEKNISQKKLSTETGISTGNISDWKSGRSAPSADKLNILADYLDCSIDYLLGRTDNPEVNKTNAASVFGTSEGEIRLVAEEKLSAEALIDEEPNHT